MTDAVVQSHILGRLVVHVYHHLTEGHAQVIQRDEHPLRVGATAAVVVTWMGGQVGGQGG